MPQLLKKHKIATSPDPDLSIIMPLYNAAPYIETAMSSILQQPDIRLEIIVINDASQDDSMAQAQKTADERVTLLSLGENVGSGRARNLALPFARAPWICPFDADDCMLENRLGPYFQWLNSQDNAFWAGCGLMVADSALEPRFHAMGQPYDLTGMLSANLVNHGMSLIRKSAIMKIGGYAENIPRGVDYAMMLKLGTLGDCCFYNEIGYFYRMHKGSVSHRYDKTNQLVHQQMKRWLDSKAYHWGTRQRVDLMRKIVFLHELVETSRWERAYEICREIRPEQPNSFELAKTAILARVMTRRFDEASQEILEWLTTHPANQLKRLEQMRRFAEQRWMADQGLRLFLGAGREELKESCISVAQELQKKQPSPQLQQLLDRCGISP